MLTVSETFGPTIQGEGPHAGQRCVFIRLGGCNLTCSWCDTPYTWDAKRFNLREELTNINPEHLTKNLPDAPVCVISGGEPLMQQSKASWAWLLKDLRQQNRRIHIETNGTLKPNQVTNDYVSFYNVSPKIQTSSHTEDKTNPEALTYFRLAAQDQRACFKFVAQDTNDLHDITLFVQQHRLPHQHVWVMPEGADRETHLHHLQQLADPIINEGYNLTTRLHTLAWNTERNR